MRLTGSRGSNRLEALITVEWLSVGSCSRESVGRMSCWPRASEGVQRLRRPDRQRVPVSGKQHPRFQRGQLRDRSSRRSPVPGRVPGWAGERCLPDGAPETDLRSTVTRASPETKTPSPRRRKATEPGVCPGVAIHSQSGRPGTAPSGSRVCATSLMSPAASMLHLVLAGSRRMIGMITQWSSGMSNSGRYLPAAIGSSSGET